MTTRQPKWTVHGEKVLKELESAPRAVRESFVRLIQSLERDPYRGVPDIMPLKGFPNGWTAPFDKGLLAYQVTVDMPTIKLKYVFWV